MIGGIEKDIETNAGDASIEVAIRAIRHEWPNALFEDALSGERFETFEQVPFGVTQEIFVYQDETAYDDWEAMGAVPQLSNTMIHLIHDDGFLTIVFDKLDGTIDKIVSGIQSALKDEVHHVFAEAV